MDPSNGGGAVTLASTISANALALNGAAGDFTLNHAGNTVATVAGNAARIAYSQSGSLAIGTVTGADASVTIGIFGQRSSHAANHGLTRQPNAE